MVFELAQCNWSFFQIDCGSKGFQVGPAQQQPRVSRKHTCHKSELSSLPNPIPVPLPPASAECCRRIHLNFTARSKANVALFH